MVSDKEQDHFLTLAPRTQNGFLAKIVYPSDIGTHVRNFVVT